MKFQKNINLSDFTTIKLGGPAKEFVECKTNNEIIEALKYAKENNLDIWILGGGSNTIFSDEGFDGLVIKIGSRGIEYDERNGFVFVRAKSGENWDSLVAECVKKNLAGIEALSGIPGSVGATPVQNVGAYGQEVSESIEKVKAISISDLKEVEFTPDECKFEYRTSRFKSQDNGKYIITEVVYRLIKNGIPKISYPELERKAHEKFGEKFALLMPPNVRELVLELRKTKSMVCDKSDPNSFSCGSFFTNPCITQKEFIVLQERNKSVKGYEEIPFYETEKHQIKIPAAWLVEQAGFTKGFKHNGAKISDRHCLSIVNNGGTANDILGLGRLIRYKVKEKFGIELEIEPVIVEYKK